MSASVSSAEQQQPFYSPFSGTTRVSQYEKKYSPTHTYPDHQPSIPRSGESPVIMEERSHCAIFQERQLICSCKLSTLLRLIDLDP